MMRQTLTFARMAWLATCLCAGAVGGTLFGLAVGGVLGAIACGICGALVGLFIGSSFLALIELLFA